MTLFRAFDQPGFGLIPSVLLGIALLVGRRFAPAPWRGWLPVIYWVGVPYLALIIGSVSPRLMGLYWLDWTATFQLGAGLLLAALALAVAVRLLAFGPIHEEGEPPARRRLALLGLAGAEEFFWCYLRAALWEIALGAVALPVAAGYAAVWLAGVVALPISLALQPTWTLRLIKTAVWVVTSVVFLYTRNFWLCWLVHAVLVVVLASAEHRTPRSAAS